MSIPPRVCFSTLACPQWSFAETAQRAADFGYDGVETRMIAGEVNLLDEPHCAPSQRAHSRRLYNDLGVALCGLASSVRFDEPQSAQREQQLEIGKRYLDLAADWGAEFVRVFGDVLPAGDARQRSITLQQIADGLNALGNYAKTNTPSVRVVLETHGDFSETNLITELFSRVFEPSVGILWDTHHPWRFFHESLTETWQRLGERTWHTHWKDSLSQSATWVSEGESDAIATATEQAKQLMSGHREAHYALFGTGEFPASDCARILKSAGYSGWHCLEWEKAWHPEIAPPEIALPSFPAAFRAIWDAC